ncbi:MAG: hypothetical protein ACR2JH_09180 [Solirubrobacteraceae bacterium]
MTLWWIGNVLFVVVIIPVVALILHRLLRPARQIKAYADDIAENGALFAPHLSVAVSELATTKALAADLRPELERYSQALDRLR